MAVTQDRFARAVPPLAVPLLAAAVMYGVVLFLPQVLYDADTFWHIAAGEKMLQLRQVLHTDPFTHTIPGAPWQTHEWLSEILMALAYRAAGWNGVVMLGGLAAGAAAFVVGAWLARFLPPLSTAVTLILSFSALSPSLLVRPHVIALPLMALWVAALMLAREKDRAPPLWLCAAMVVWANLHGSYVFGIALIGPFALEALIGAPRARWLEVTWRWGLFGVLTVLAALVTPHGIEGLIHPFQLMTMTSLPNIVEWRPINFGKPGPFELALMATLFVAFSRGVKMPLVRLSVLLGLFHMALQHVRHVVVLGVVGPMLLARPLGEALAPDHLPELGRRARPAMLIGLAVVLALTGARLIHPLVRTDGYHAPISALEAVPAEVRSKPVLNSYGLGGYLIFKGVKVFMDGRADMYGDAYTANYMKIERGDEAALDKAIARYRIEWMFLNPKAGVARVMAKKPGWTRIHADGQAVVYVRSTSLPPSTTR